MNHDLDPDLDALGARLTAERPRPRPTFRGELRRRLSENGVDPPPRRLRLLIGAYAGSGALLLGIVAIGIAGIGPLAA